MISATAQSVSVASQTTVSPGSTAAHLATALEEFVRETGCHSVAVARRDGLVIAHLLPRGKDPRVSASLAASIFGAAEIAVHEFGHAGLEQVLISTPTARIIACGAGPDAIVITLFHLPVNLGMALLQLSHVAEEVAAVLEGV